jgi:hypothetical protein
MLVMGLRWKSVALCNANLSSAAHAAVNTRKWSGYSGLMIGIERVVLFLFNKDTILISGHLPLPRLNMGVYAQ